MNDVSYIVLLIFVLSLILLLVVYYQGVNTDVGAFNNAIQSLIMVGTGRNPTTGAFAGYPTHG